LAGDGEFLSTPFYFKGGIPTKYQINYNSRWPRRRHMVPAFMVHSFFGDGIILEGEIY
jgi:hypothetical protein